MNCTYCGSDLDAYDPIFCEETEDGTRVPAGQFCNYGCLSAHIEEANLACGDACEWSPDC